MPRGLVWRVSGVVGGAGGLLAPFESGGDQRVGDHRVRAALRVMDHLRLFYSRLVPHRASLSRRA